MLRTPFAALGVAGAVAAFLSASPVLASTSTPAHVDTSGVNMQPAYPDSALPAKESGAVVINASVGPDGKVQKVKLYSSSGFDDLDNAAANAVRSWKFVPATENGTPTDAWTKVQIVFQPPAAGQ